MSAADHEQAWAEALAEEHGHQQELLATLRNELGTFARECASALTATWSSDQESKGFGFCSVEVYPAVKS